MSTGTPLRLRVRLSLVAVLTLCACASQPSAFKSQWATAQQRYDAGRFEDAAQRWQAASEIAASRKDRDEARFRSAGALLRAGRQEEAEAVFRDLAAQDPPGHRSARGLYELSRLARRSGDRQRELQLLGDCVARFPTASIAPAAVRNLDLAAREMGGPSRAAAELGRLLGKVPKGKIDEALRFARARALLEQGRDDQARQELIGVVEAYPYPLGASWDDALWQLALLDEKRGNVEGAIGWLERMLSQREQSKIAGSYERPKFAHARYKIAELLWNSSNDPAAASREFERVQTDHATHRLADDGLWQAARAAHAAGDVNRACALVERLEQLSPTEPSRYVGCGHLVCPNPTTAERECRDYVRRAHETAPNRAESIE